TRLEPSDPAISYGHVVPVRCDDAHRLRAGTGSQVPDFELVAVDGDVVRVDGDGAASCKRSTYMPLETVDPLRTDDGRYRLNFHTFGCLSRGRLHPPCHCKQTDPDQAPAIDLSTHLYSP